MANDYLTVPCAACGASVGEFCIWNGVRVPDVCHSVRIEAASAGTQRIPEEMIEKGLEDANAI